MATRMEKVRDKVRARINTIISEVAWRGEDGHCCIEEENFENLEIKLVDYITPLLLKAGWFVDEDDGLLTCVRNGKKKKENEIYLERRPIEEMQKLLQTKMAEFQLEIAVKALNDIASIGNPSAVTTEEPLGL